MRLKEPLTRPVPLKLLVLRLLRDEGKQRFYQICNTTQPAGDPHVNSVKTANCLRGLVEEELIEKEYVKRETWYEITDKGRNWLQKSEAESEISDQQPWSFSNCEVIKSADGKGDASVYWSTSIDQEAKMQISDLLSKYKGIKIIGHYTPSEEH
jgi:DNA-binding PadR family transcriptional regulator